MKLWLLRPMKKFFYLESQYKNDLLYSTLRRIPRIEDNPWLGSSYDDMTYGFVICAESEERARHIAQYNDSKIWLDQNFTTCVELKPEMFEKEELIMVDFKDG
jgi:hypothetical protein